MASAESPLPTHGDAPATTESEPLLGRPGDAIQKPDASMIHNFFLGMLQNQWLNESQYRQLTIHRFLGTGKLAQAGAILLLAIIWASVFSNPTLPLVSPHPLLQSLGVYTVLQAILILQPTNTPHTKFLGQRAHFFMVRALPHPHLTSHPPSTTDLHPTCLSALRRRLTHASFSTFPTKTAYPFSVPLHRWDDHHRGEQISQRARPLPLGPRLSRRCYPRPTAAPVPLRLHHLGRTRGMGRRGFRQAPVEVSPLGRLRGAAPAARHRRRCRRD